jgi:hypothetical protein
MIGLSSVTYIKKSPTTSLSKEAPPSISTSMSSPRMTSCRSPFDMKRQQLPVFIRKQQQEEVLQEDVEDDREIVKKNGIHNAYGVPAMTKKKQATQSDLNQKIRVCVRKRPLSKRELEKSEKDITPVASVRAVHVNEPK